MILSTAPNQGRIFYSVLNHFTNELKYQVRVIANGVFRLKIVIKVVLHIYVKKYEKNEKYVLRVSSLQTSFLWCQHFVIRHTACNQIKVVICLWHRHVKFNPDKQGITKASSHYNDFMMSAMASPITSFVIVHSTVYSGSDQRKHQSSALLAFVNPLVTSELPTQRASNTENVSIWWRHHVMITPSYNHTYAISCF